MAAAPTLNTTRLPGRDVGSSTLKLSAIMAATAKSTTVGNRFRSPLPTATLAPSAPRPPATTASHRIVALRESPNIKEKTPPQGGGAILVIYSRSLAA